MDDSYLISVSPTIARSIKANVESLKLEASTPAQSDRRSLRECLLIIDDKEHSLCVPEGRGSIELWKSFDGTHTLKSSDLQHVFVCDNATLHENDELSTSSEIQHW